jgi:hypothetical protein
VSRTPRTSRGRCWIPLALLACASACIKVGGTAPVAPRPVPTDRSFTASTRQYQQVTLDEVDEMVYAFADRYNMVIGSAVDSVKRNNPDPDQRRLAHGVKLNGMLAVSDIASSPDPYAKVLDLVTAVTLQSMVWIDENRAEEAFGERAPVLIKAMREMREEVWDIAARALRQDQLETLDLLIGDWRRTHPQVDQVAFVKFDNFAGVRAMGLTADLRTGTGLMAPLTEMSQEAREYRRLAERAFWYTKRAPNVAGIQAEAAVNEILATPEADQLTLSMSQFGVTADRMGALLDSLPGMLDDRQRQITGLMRDANELVATVNHLTASANRTLTTLGETMQVADEVVGKYYAPDTAADAGKPFDINEYTRALSTAGEVVAGMNQLTRNGGAVLESPGWRLGLVQLSTVADRRVDRVFMHVYATIGLIFVLALAYRVISARLRSRSAETHAAA